MIYNEYKLYLVVGELLSNLK